MFLRLWYYIQGYVMIKAKGFAAERLMNMLSYRGVTLWDVAPVGVGVQMKVPKSAMDTIEACAEKTGCTIEVIAYGGLPARLRRFRGRPFLLGGLLLFSLGLYLLSSFVWVIEVTGNERVSKEEILAYCEDLGLRPGAWKRGIDTARMTKEVLTHFSDISWVSVGVQGTDVRIKVAETIEKTPVIDKATPADMIATTDAVVLKITAERGTPLVQAGDVVKKGEVLISSQVMIGLEGEEQRATYVAAQGVVMGRIWNHLTEEIPLTYTEPLFDETKEKTNVSLSLWGREVDLIQPDIDAEVEREMIYEKQLALGDFQFPIKIRKERLRPFIMEEKSRTIPEAKAELTKILREKTTQTLSSYGTIEEIKIVFEEYTDRVRAVGEASLTERIGVCQPTKGGDALDGTDRENHGN